MLDELRTILKQQLSESGILSRLYPELSDLEPVQTHHDSGICFHKKALNIFG